MNDLRGKGTKSQPYKLDKPSDFISINEFSGNYYEMTSDLYLSGNTTLFTIIDEFHGVLDGKGYRIFNSSSNKGLVQRNQGVIKNLSFVNNKVHNEYSVGIVSTVNEQEGDIENINVISSDIRGDSSSVGALVGTNNGRVKKCKVYGSSVKGKDNVGGLVGDCTDAEISDCSISNTVINGGLKVGGIAGKVSGVRNKETGIFGIDANSICIKCTNKFGGVAGYSGFNIIEDIHLEDVYLDGGDFCGGVSGKSQGTHVENCEVIDLRIEAGRNVGGLVGKTHKSDIMGCVAYSSINSINRAGGLIGDNHGQITDSYCYLKFNEDNMRKNYDNKDYNYSNVGSIVGTNYGNIYDCYHHGSSKIPCIGKDKSFSEGVEKIEDLEIINSKIVSNII